MQEEMNQAEVAREETEQKMIYKFLLMIKESESLEELEKKLKPCLINKQGKFYSRAVLAAVRYYNITIYSK